MYDLLLDIVYTSLIVLNIPKTQRDTTIVPYITNAYTLSFAVWNDMARTCINNKPRTI